VPLLDSTRLHCEALADIIVTGARPMTEAPAMLMKGLIS
jgi:hypothetical protein